MDAVTRKKKKEIDKERFLLKNRLASINAIIFEYGNLFKKEESIKALKEITEYYKREYNFYISLCEESKQIEDECNHEFIITDKHKNNYCLICGGNNVEEKEITIEIENKDIELYGISGGLMIEYLKYYGFRDEINIISKLFEIIEKGLENSGNYIEEELEDLQYEEEIKVRRKIK